MAGIRGTNTKPELRLRSALHREGFRYRIHDGRLPGRPDLVLPRHNAVIFIHGCFWHRHEGCRWSTTPASNIDFWSAKFASNVDRDDRHRQSLRQAGWRVAIAWECAVRHDLSGTVAGLTQWLRSAEPAWESMIVRLAADAASSADPADDQDPRRLALRRLAIDSEIAFVLPRAGGHH